MGEKGFWVNLDLFIDRQNEALDNWLGGKAISLNSPQEPEEPKKRDSKPMLENQESSDLGDAGGISSMKTLTSVFLATRKQTVRKISANIEVSVRRKSVSGKAKEKAKRLYKLRRFRRKKKCFREEENLVVGPIVDCSFNLPRVSSQLERLMGTNVVRLTDRKYMQELRKRIKEDYNVVLQKRIAQRETKEIERTRNLLIEGYTGNSSVSTEGPPVVIISKQTHSDMARRRAKLKTVRERNAERLVRQGIKWEKERLAHLELERQRQIEAQQKREEELMIGHEERFAKNGNTGIQISYKMRNRRDVGDDDDFSDTDRYDHNDLSSGINSDTDDNNSNDFDEDVGNVPEGINETNEGEVTKKTEALEHLQYEDPAITLLKATDNVDDLYALADEIISGSYGKHNAHKSGDNN
ncbi:inner centromere protein A [Lutzomyia longipalpis]|nr:inner centromere protein A [Lutzomyia longipalpis]